MSLTKPLNSKVNMKQYSNADLPVNPKQPAVARYAAESTANQTTINLPFQVDTVNAADSFLLMVDGKVLTPGSTNDYQFAGIDSFGFSSTVSLNYSLSAGLNIQAIKLGLKKELEFAQDARFTALYEGIDQGLQGFVRTSDLMVATATVGTPASGQFYSSIQNRAAMPDMRFDLKARMGIERIMFEGLYRVLNEFGANGEPVYAVASDTLGQVRWVGQQWSGIASGNAQADIFTSITNGGVNSYIEIVFYGTGLNLVGFQDAQSGNDWRVSIDGGAEGANIYYTDSAILSNRNYSKNLIIPLASGLPQGVHTVRVRAAAGSYLTTFGMEIVNDTSTIMVNPGASYVSGKKLTSIAQTSLSYNSGFESGTLGARGGRVIVYQKSDGSFGKALTPANVTQLNLTAADHSNEEIARVHQVTEFGVGLAGDMTTQFGTNAIRAYGLDDGVTSLMGSSNAPSVFQNTTTLGFNTNAAVQFTFVGTGLDLIFASASATGSFSITVDNTAIGSISLAGSPTGFATYKVVSGLPYGTHTVLITSASVTNVGLNSLITYQPKKPSIPVGAVEISDYNIMATYVANTGTARTSIATGVLRNYPTRGYRYSGTWSIDSSPNYADSIGGFNVFTSTNGGFFEYTFWGTGFELRIPSTAGTDSASCLIQLNGLNANTTNYPSLATSAYGSITYNATTAIMAQNVASGAIYQGVRLSNLPLARYTIRVTNQTANRMIIGGMDVITPIHSPKLVTPHSQNTMLMVGNTGISDTRRFSPIKDTSAVTKNTVYVQGTQSDPTSTATTPIPMPDMGANIRVNSNSIRVSYSVTTAMSAVLNSFCQVYVDGVPVGVATRIAHNTGWIMTKSDSLVIPVSPGVHRVELYWWADGGTQTATSTLRKMTVEEK